MASKYSTKPQVDVAPPEAEEKKEESKANRVEKAWAKFITAFKDSNKAWDELNELIIELGYGGVEELEMNVQKMIIRFGKQRFDIMLPRLIAFAQGIGGLKELK